MQCPCTCRQQACVSSRHACVCMCALHAHARLDNRQQSKGMDINPCCIYQLPLKHINSDKRARQARGHAWHVHHAWPCITFLAPPCSQRARACWAACAQPACCVCSLSCVIHSTAVFLQEWNVSGSTLSRSAGRSCSTLAQRSE